MPNRTFFLDSETRHSSRSRSLPIRSRPESIATPSNQAQTTQDQPRSGPEASYRRYARRLAKTERSRNDRRQLYRQNPIADQSKDFAATFQCPPGPQIAANLNNAAADLAWCSLQYPPHDITSLTPMERFLIIDTGEEQWCVDSTVRPHAIGVREGHVSSSKDRLSSAVELAADVKLIRRQAALRGPKERDEDRNHEGNGRSWLNLDDDSQISCSGGSRRIEKETKCPARRAKSSQNW